MGYRPAATATRHAAPDTALGLAAAMAAATTDNAPGYAAAMTAAATASASTMRVSRRASCGAAGAAAAAATMSALLEMLVMSHFDEGIVDDVSFECVVKVGECDEPIAPPPACIARVEGLRRLITRDVAPLVRLADHREGELSVQAPPGGQGDKI